MLCFTKVMLCYVLPRLCYVMFYQGYVMLCYVLPRFFAFIILNMELVNHVTNNL